MRTLGLLAALAIGCGPSTARAPEPARPRVIELPRASSEAATLTPPTSRLPHCEIRGRREISHVTLFVAPDDATAAATLLRASETQLSWSGFRRGTAALEFRVEHVMHFSGFAHYDDDWFRVTRRVEVVPGLAWSWRGAMLRPESEEDDGRLLASFETPFAAPARLEARVECGSVGFEEIAPERPSFPEHTESLWRPGPELQLRAAPSDTESLRVTYREASGYHRGTERVPGWVRIMEIGNALMLQAWVEESAFRKPPRRLGGSHRVKPPRTRSDSIGVTVPSAEVIRAGPLFIGSKTNRVAFAEIEAGAIVDVVERDGDFAGILFESNWVAPQNGLFWLERSLLGPERPAK